MKNKNKKINLTSVRRSANNHKFFDNFILWTVDEVAEALSLSKGTIYNKVSSGAIPYHKKGKKLYFLQEEILNWVMEGNL